MKEIRPLILFVDDEELARKTFKRIVEKDFRVMLASSVDEAMLVLDEHHKDIGVLLSDQRMPDKLGVDLLEYCRAQYPNIVRLLTTAYSELEDAIAAVNRGEIIRYIEKPWKNIDAMLMDIKLAATVYQIKKENQQLVDQKLSVGFKNSQMEKIRALITIAACQQSEHSMQAVESMLRQIAEVKACYALPDIDDLRKLEMFEQPLNNAIAAIELGHRISCSGGISTLTAEAKDRIKTTINDIEVLPEDQLTAIISNCLLVLGNDANIQILPEKDWTIINIATETQGPDCIKQWLGSIAESSAESSHKMARLLNVFLAVFHGNGRVQLDIDTNGVLGEINIQLFESEAVPQQYTEADLSFDWIHDLMILFS